MISCLPVKGLIIEDTLTVFTLFWEGFILGIGHVQLEKTAHEKVIIEIGEGNGCKLNCSELDVSPFVLLGDERNVAEVAKQVVNASDSDVFLELVAESRRFGMYAFLYFQ